MCVFIYKYKCLHMYIHICIYECVCICVCYKISQLCLNLCSQCVWITNRDEMICVPQCPVLYHRLTPISRGQGHHDDEQYHQRCVWGLRKSLKFSICNSICKSLSTPLKDSLSEFSLMWLSLLNSGAFIFTHMALNVTWGRQHKEISNSLIKLSMY